METVTLHADDFRTVHNTLCELRSLVERMTHTMIKIDDVQRIVEGFEQGLRSAYEQDEAAFDRKMQHYREVQAQLGLTAIWSEFAVDNLSDPHPFEGALQLAYTTGWGEPQFVEIVGTTWAALYVAANRAIRDSGDGHHIFIEGFRHNPLCPEQLFLSTGS